jgi:class 3 adenylate cyclase
MEKNKKPIIPFVICIMVFLLCTAACLLNFSFLRKPIFQKKTNFDVASAAKYEKDGNLYVIDSGSFRLICMTVEGDINYVITIDKMKEYVKIFDCAVDEAGNLYLYATELEYDAFLTKRDMIRKYDRYGRFEKNILTLEYTDNSADRPHTFAQFGSMNCEGGVLTFSRVQQNQVTLYHYNIIQDSMTTSVFSENVVDFSVARLALKDFNNFIYSTRNGDVYEVQNCQAPLLRASFNFNEKSGGIIPWHLYYDSRGNIIFLDMASSAVYRIEENTLAKVIPEQLFASFRDIFPGYTGFGFYNEHFAGVYGDKVWYYDGKSIKTYDEGLVLAFQDRLHIIAVQMAFFLGIFVFLVGIYLLFIRILDKYISLFIKQIAIIIPIIIVAFIVFYSITFKLMSERLNKEIFNELLLAANLSSKMIDGDDIDALQNVRDYNNDAYKRLSRNLKESIGNNQDEWNKLYYAALYKVINNTEYFLILSNDEANMYRPFVFIEEGSGEAELVKTGKAFADIANYVDGDWAYSNVPIYNSGGKLAGIFEIGLDLTGSEIINARHRREIALIAAAICVIILIFLSVIMSVIVKQLSLVAGVLGSIAGGNYAARVGYQARDELGVVSRGLNHMATELESQFRHISSLTESSIRFVPVQFMEHLGVTDITKMKLGDHVQRDLTVLFFDIRAFSVNSEIMSARENFLFINKVLGVAGPILRKHNGFVDKYLGDAAMALFVDARDAVRAGIEVYQSLILDKKTRVRIGGDGINIGVGLHTGSVMMGIVGENERLSSTVISKNVNMASRLESLTKQTGSGMLISRDTMNQISGSEKEFNYRFIGMIRAAGVNEVLGVFDILDALAPDLREKRMLTKKIFESGIRKYHTKDYAAAIKRFEKVIMVDPGDICAVNCLAETRRRLEDPSLPSVFMFDKK